MNEWPLLRNDSDPDMREYELIAVVGNPGEEPKSYRVTVVAHTRQEACREIIHFQMNEGFCVRSIRDFR